MPRSQSVATENAPVGITSTISDVFAGRLASDAKFALGVNNLSQIRTFEDVEVSPMPQRPFVKGVMGFRRNGRSLNLTIACGKTMVRQITLPRFIAMVENMNDENNATIVLENFTEGEENRLPRGQVLGHINKTFSCITVAQGLTGRVIHGPSDLARLDVYYLAKDQLMACYIAAKYQIGADNDLDEMIGAFDGWKAFDIPADLLNP
jgi:hypothetical protein